MDRQRLDVNTDPVYRPSTPRSVRSQRSISPGPFRSVTHTFMLHSFNDTKPVPWGNVRQAYTRRKILGFKSIWENDPGGLQEFLNSIGAKDKIEDFRDPAGATLLHVAVLNNKYDMVKIILEFCPNLVFTGYSGNNYTGETPLHLAVVKGNMRIIRLLSLVALRLTNGSVFEITDPIHDDELRQGYLDCPEATKKFVNEPLAVEMFDEKKYTFVGRDFRKPGPKRPDEELESHDELFEGKDHLNEGVLFYGGSILAFAVMAQREEVIKFLVDVLQVDITYTDSLDDRQTLDDQQFNAISDSYFKSMVKISSRHLNDWRPTISLAGPKFEGYTVFHLMAHHGKFNFRNERGEETDESMFEYLKARADNQLKKYAIKNGETAELNTWWKQRLLTLKSAVEMYSEHLNDKKTDETSPHSSKHSRDNINNFFYNMMNWRAKVYTGRNYNHDGYEYLTPTETAVFHRHPEIFSQIKQLVWEFGPTRCIQFPLNYLYVPNERCSLRIAVENGDVDTLKHSFFRMLLKIIWELGDERHISHQDYYHLRFFATLFTMIFYTLHLSMLPQASVHSIPNDPTSPLIYSDRRSNWYIPDSNRLEVGRIFVDVVTAFAFLVIFLVEANQIFWDFRGYFKTYIIHGFTRASTIFRWGIYICLMTALIIRFHTQSVDWNVVEDVALGVCSILGWMYLTFFAKASIELGPLMVIVERVLKRDVAQWILLFGLLVLSFTGILFLLDSDNLFVLPMYNIVNILFQTGIAPTTETTHNYALAILIWIVAQFTMMVLMVNILIAMLNETFIEIRNRAPIIWLLQWAKIALAMDFRNRKVHEISIGFTYREEEDTDVNIAMLQIKPNDNIPPTDTVNLQRRPTRGQNLDTSILPEPQSLLYVGNQSQETVPTRSSSGRVTTPVSFVGGNRSQETIPIESSSNQQLTVYIPQGSSPNVVQKWSLIRKQLSYLTHEPTYASASSRDTGIHIRVPSSILGKAINKLEQEVEGKSVASSKADILADDSCLSWILVIEKEDPRSPGKFMPIKFCYKNTASTAGEAEWQSLHNLVDFKREKSMNLIGTLAAATINMLIRVLLFLFIKFFGWFILWRKDRKQQQHTRSHRKSTFYETVKYALRKNRQTQNEKTAQDEELQMQDMHEDSSEPEDISEQNEDT